MVFPFLKVLFSLYVDYSGSLPIFTFNVDYLNYSKVTEEFYRRKSELKFGDLVQL